MKNSTELAEENVDDIKEDKIEEKKPQPEKIFYFDRVLVHHIHRFKIQVYQDTTD